MLLDQTHSLETEKINFIKSLNRVLAENIYSDMDMPPFDKAAMDGFACRIKDINSELTVIEEVQAGKVPLKNVGKNECTKIMTGAMIPPGADCVIMIEHTETTSPGKIRFIHQKSNLNICYKGEDIKKGELVLKKGTQIQPQHVAILASAGSSEPTVFKIPQIAVLSTSNELVEPEVKPFPSQIRNSNGHQLVAQCAGMGIKAHYAGIAPDDKQSLQLHLAPLLAENDIVIITGGVSMGDYDFVPEVLNEMGLRTILQGINIKPGKRVLVTAGQIRNDPADKIQRDITQNKFVISEDNIQQQTYDKKSFCFGLPGNPVSSFVLFEILIKPFIQKMCGIENTAHSIMLPLDEDYHRKDEEKLWFVPVILSENKCVKSVEYHGSAHIHSYVSAMGIMEVPAGKKSIKKGELVNVRPI